MRKQIVRIMVPAIRYSTLSKKINKNVLLKSTKEEEKKWNKFFQNISSLYIKKNNILETQRNSVKKKLV